MTDTLNDTRNIRMWAWEKKYPSCTEQIVEVFDKIPSVKEVAKWKEGWVDVANNEFCIGSSIGLHYNTKLLTYDDIKKITLNLGIHPYFWDTRLRTELHDEGGIDIEGYDITGKKVKFGSYYETKTMVSFFYEEHLIMFKLAWQA